MTRQVALVGYSFRLPGAQVEALWKLLCEGRNLVSTVEDTRWVKDPYLHPSRAEPGSSYTFAAGSLGDISGFDAEFFGISPREAAQMDPQQRLLLELTWEALEHGGIKPSTVQGSRSAVYVGLSSVDYAYRRADDLCSIDASTMTGNTASIAANRLSYFFDLRGPSVTVDTACSSALVAFHLACQSIRTGESTHAITGGVSLHLHPFAFVGFSKASMLSPSGTCRVFDDNGDGYVRSEGGGIFILKDLEEALADGDRVIATVAGSGTNCDGRTPGLTVPSAAAQTRLLREVYAQAGIRPSEIDYLEAHGTGTRVGDPIEASAIGQALGQPRPADAPLLIGSIKSNLGHLEAASGVAGLVKSLLCLQHRSVPPSIHLEKPNSRISFDEWNIHVVTEVTPLPEHKDLIIGVNSFGFGGTNAHVILKGVVARPRMPDTSSDSPAPLILSGRNEQALRANAQAFAGHLETDTQSSLYDTAYTAAYHRDLHEHRLIAFAPSRETLAEMLTASASGNGGAFTATGKALPKPSRPVFVYSGNGSQWVGMGRVLLAADELFRNTLEKLDALFSVQGGFSIIDELRAEDVAQRIDLTEVAQPMLFAIQVGITTMLRAWGIEPMAVVGHSVGEVAAAWAAGALSLPQAVRVIFVRSLEQGKTKGAGGMTAIGLSFDALNRLLGSLELSHTPAIAGINSPRGVTVAGPTPVLDTLERALAEQEVFFRRLPLDYAFHSAAMDPLESCIKGSLSDLKPKSTRTAFFSTVSGTQLGGDQLGGHYWWRNVRDTVRFESAINALQQRGANVFIEIGPHAVLRNYVGDCLRQTATDGRVIATMLRADDRPERLRDALFQVMIAGSPIDMSKLFPHRGNFVDIPHYPWQRETCWHPLTSEGYNLINRYTEHPLLGYRLRENAWQWENQLDSSRFPMLADHRVGDSVVFPAAGFIEMALGASELRFGGLTHVIEDFEIRAPLLLDSGPSKTVRFKLDDLQGNFTILSRERLTDEPWLVNAVGRMLGPLPAGAAMEPQAVPKRSPDILADEHYASCEAVGLRYGPAFQTVRRIWLNGRSATAELRMPAGVFDNAGGLITPPMLDGCFQLLLDIVKNAAAGSRRLAFVPTTVERIVLHRPRRAGVFGQAVLSRRNPRSLAGDFTLRDAVGLPIASLFGVRFRGVDLSEGRAEQLQYLAFSAVPMPFATDTTHAALPPSDILLSAATHYLHAEARVAERTRYYEEVEPLLDVLCASFAERALRDLCPGEQLIDPSALFASGTLAAGLEPYFLRLVEILQEDGVIEPTDGGWRWSPDSGTPDPETVWISLIGDYPDYAAGVITSGRFGRHLSQLLTGRMELSLLSRGIQPFCSALAVHPSLHDFYRAMADLVKAAQERLPIDRRLRIVELCSQESHLALRVLPWLDRDRVDYLIVVPTDTELTDRAALLQNFPRVAIRPLDFLDGESLAMERDRPCADLLLIPEGLAGAMDPGSFLSGVGRLLAEDGMLLVIEQYPSRSADLVWGSQPGWWQAGVDDTRSSRLLSPQHWKSLVARSGFEKIRMVHDVPGVDSGYFMILSRNARRRTEAGSEAPTASQTWLMVHEKSAGGYTNALSSAVAADLWAQGHIVIHARAGDDFAPDTAEQTSLNGPGIPQFDALLGLAREGAGEFGGILIFDDPGSPQEAPEQLLQQQQHRCEMVLSILNSCMASGIYPPCWLVTCQGAAHLLPRQVRESLSGASGCGDAAFWGFARTLMNEYPEIAIRLVDCADPDKLERMATGLVKELLQAEDDENEIILTDLGRFVPRLQHAFAPSAANFENIESPGLRPVQLDFSSPGPLKNLLWRGVDPMPLESDQVEIAVRAAGLNFRDVMYAMGLLSDEAVESGFAGATLGMELAGVVIATGNEVHDFKPGDEVMAFAPSSFATRAVTRAGAVAIKPAAWSFESAATVPIAFFTVYYALHHLAQLREGERILIHGAAGGVGIAAIQFAKHVGAEIFATAGSDEKRDFVRLLGVDHVLDSRSLAFADEILQLTRGEGVDIVLNSLAGEAINRNLRVLKPFGRFLELGKRDFYENTKIGLRPFRNNIAYFGIDADQLMGERPDLTRRLFLELLSLFEQGALKPLPYRSFSSAEVVDAFRYMQQSKQIGKVVVRLGDAIEPCLGEDDHVSGWVVRPDAVYLISGGLSGLGLKTAEWLAKKGARHLVLISRSGRPSTAAASVIAGLTAQDVAVRMLACDVTDRTATSSLLSELTDSSCPLAGIIHAAAVIADGLSHTLSGEQIGQVFAPKLLGALAFADYAQHSPLDFLVFFSSATTLFGNPGQANYVGANHFLEALTESLRSDRVPAYCMSFGPISDIGYLARNDRIRKGLEARLGGAALTSDEALEALDRMIGAGTSGLGVVNLDWNSLRRALPSAGTPKFRDLLPPAEDDAETAGGADAVQRWLDELPDEEFIPHLVDLLKRELGVILKIAQERLDEHRSVHDLGMDSLMGMELITALENRLGVRVPIMLLSEGPTIARLAEKITKQLRSARSGGDRADSASSLTHQIQHVASVYASELSSDRIDEITADFGNRLNGDESGDPTE